MPRKTGYKKKTRRKTGKTKTSIMKVPRPFMKEPIYYFKRKMQHTLDPVNSDALAPWVAANNGIVYSHNFKLSDLPSYSEFVNLFETYKIMGVQLEFHCASTATLASQRTAGASTVITRIKPNTDCRLLGSGDTVNNWLQRTDVKRYIFPNQHDKPLRIYQPCKMKNELVDAYPQVVKPGWVPTANYNNDNFTVDMRMDLTSGEDITNNALTAVPKFTIIETVYLAFKGVQ